MTDADNLLLLCRCCRTYFGVMMMSVTLLFCHHRAEKWDWAPVVMIAGSRINTQTVPPVPCHISTTLMHTRCVLAVTLPVLDLGVYL